MKQISLLLLAGSLFAAGNFSWIENGVSIRQGVHIEWQRTGDSGADGEMIFAWSDTRTGDRDIYVQKVDTSGTLLWGEMGIRATVADGRQEDPVLVSDGAGGAFLAWIDYRDDEYGDVYGQHINADGELSWEPSGVPLAVNSGLQQSVNMARGDVGVAYVIWDDGSQSASGDIFGTVLTTSGPLASGGSDGLVLVNASGTQTNHSIETSGSEVVVVWRDTRDVNDADIYGQRLDANFTGLWGVNGVLVCGNESNQAYPKVAPADGDRVAVSWLDFRNNIKSDIFSQLFNADGTPAWTVDGITLTNLDSEQRACRVKSNGVDRIYYVWEDLRNNSADPDIYMQSLDLSGSAQWVLDGISISEHSLKQIQPRFTMSTNGGVYVTWLDERNGGFPQSDVYLQYVHPDGSIGFTENGLALTDDKKYQLGGLVRSDGAGGAIVLWSNASSGSIGITGQHITAAGTQTLDVNGTELFFGIDGDASKFQTLTWGDSEAMIFWEDNRWAGTGAVAMAQVMDRSATIHYTMDGVSLSGNEQQMNPVIATDNAGGAYLSYTNSATGTELLFIQHVDQNLEPTWPAAGFQVNPNTIGQDSPQLISAADGSLYYFWSDFDFISFTGFQLYSQKYDVLGNPQWTEGGIQHSFDGIAGDKYVNSMTEMGDGSIVFVWEAVTVDFTHTYASKIDSDGTIIWTSAVTEASGFQHSSITAYDSVTDILTIGWEDGRNTSVSGLDLYAVSIDADGNLGEEQLISNQFGDQSNLALSYSDDGSGILYAAWQDYDGFQHDVFVKNLTTDTEAEQITSLETENKNPALRAVTGDRFLLAWEDDRNGFQIHTDLYFYDSAPESPGHLAQGVPLSLSVLNQREPQIIPFSDNSTSDMGYMIVWQDMRSSGKTELTNIYAQAYTGRFASIDEPVVAQDFRVGDAYPNPFNGEVSIPIENLIGSNLEVHVYDLKGRLVFNENISEMRGQNYVWNGLSRGGNALSSGIYLISVRSDLQQNSQKIMLVK